MSYKVRETPTHIYFLTGPYSQWHPTIFHGKLMQDGPVLRFTYREQYMMARKAVPFGDLMTLDAIMAAPKPWAQKALGRVVGNFTEQQSE